MRCWQHNVAQCRWLRCSSVSLTYWTTLLIWTRICFHTWNLHADWLESYRSNLYKQAGLVWPRKKIDMNLILTAVWLYILCKYAGTAWIILDQGEILFRPRKCLCMGAPLINPPTSRRIGARMGTWRRFFLWRARMQTSCLQWKSQVIWDTLQGITFNHNFNQSLDNICFPRSLQSLTFGSGYYQSINNVTFPIGLLSLTFVW